MDLSVSNMRMLSKFYPPIIDKLKLERNFSLMHWFKLSMENLTAGRWNVLHYSVKIPFHLSRVIVVDDVQATRVAIEIQLLQMLSENHASLISIFILTIKHYNYNQKIVQRVQHARWVGIEKSNQLKLLL